MYYFIKKMFVFVLTFDHDIIIPIGNSGSFIMKSYKFHISHFVYVLHFIYIFKININY